MNMDRENVLVALDSFVEAYRKAKVTVVNEVFIFRHIGKLIDRIN